MYKLLYILEISRTNAASVDSVYLDSRILEIQCMQ